MSPTRSATVFSSRSGSFALMTSCVNSLLLCSTVPSGAITALIPLVAAATTARPCSTARSRYMASCCSGWPVRP